jgi:hypothetical protein
VAAVDARERNAETQLKLSSTLENKPIAPIVATMGNPQLETWTPRADRVNVMESALKKSTCSPDDQESDAWSDPRAERRQTFSPPISEVTGAKTARGIQIPTFLQPLLGLDFIPYLPKDQDIFPTEDDDDLTVTEHDLEELDLVRSATDNDKDLLDSSLESRLLAPDRRPSNIDPAPTLLTEAVESEEAPTSSSKRRTRGRSVGASFVKFVKSKRQALPLPRNKSSARNRIKSWHGESFPPTISEASPKKGDSITSHQLDWVETQQQKIVSHQAEMDKVQRETRALQARTMNIENRVSEVQMDIFRLQQALEKSQQQLRSELDNLGNARTDLCQLEHAALQAVEDVVTTMQEMKLGLPISPSPLSSVDDDVSSEPKTLFLDVLQSTGTPQPLRGRAATAPSQSSSFMRIHDLEIDTKDLGSSQHETASSVSSSSLPPTNKSAGDFFFIDHDVTTILDNLSRLGYDMATDESDRFIPTSHTERKLASYGPSDSSLIDWPVRPYKAAQGNDVLVWTGGVEHNGFGSDWPVVKARGIVRTPPLELTEFLIDSSKIKQYNKISQGREDLLVIQKGIHTTAAESDLGFSGAAKIIKSLNKPRLLPKTIEMLSLMYSQPLSNAPGSYMTVIRSVFEDDSGEHKITRSTIRFEMMLGVILIRPVDADHTVSELTYIAHVYTPGVPEMLAKRAAPSSTANFIKDLQAIFKKQ